MYIIIDDRIIRPPSDAMRSSSPTSEYDELDFDIDDADNIAIVICKILLYILIILLVVYVFTCGTCKDVLKLFKPS